MAADPPDAAAVNSVHVRASALQAVSAHALQHARATPGPKGSSFNVLSSLGDQDAEEPPPALAAAVATRNQRALHFAPTAVEHTYDANAGVSAPAVRTKACLLYTSDAADE